MPQERPMVTKLDLRQLLLAWQSGEITTVDYYKKVSDYHGNYDRPDDNEAVNEFLGELEMGDVNLLIKDDIPALLDILEQVTSSQDCDLRFKQLYTTYDAYERAKALVDEEPYAPAARSMTKRAI